MNIIHANVSGDNIGWGSIPRRGQTATRPRCIRNQQLCVHYVLCTLSTAQCSVCAQCAAHQRLWSLGCGNELWIVSSAILSCAFCKINSLMCALCNARCANNIGDRKIPFFHSGKCCSSTVIQCEDLVWETFCAIEFTSQMVSQHYFLFYHFVLKVQIILMCWSGEGESADLKSD